jgi:hypothetical protein
LITAVYRQQATSVSGPGPAGGRGGMVAIVDPHGVAGAGHQLKPGVGKLLDERLGKVGTAQMIAPHRDEPSTPTGVRDLHGPLACRR